MEEEPCLENGQKRIFASDGEPRKRRRNCCSRIRMEGPDGGWAWAVAFAACIISFIMAGLGRMSGILYVAFIDTFKVDRMAASTPFSVRSSTRNLLGPVVGILGQKYGVRAVTITGGILATISASACFYAPDIVWITILWGILNGVGTALSVTLPQVVIGKYFIKYTTTASGMAFSGGCVGSFVFPVLLEELLHSYGMQGTFLVIGAIIMHTIPAGMVLRTPPWLKAKHKSNSQYSDDEIDASTARSRSGSVAVRNESSVKILLNGKDMIEDETRYGSGKSKKDQNFPDIQYLRDNPDLVLKILSLKALGENCSKYSLEINQNDEEIAILDKMEELLCFIEKFKEKPMSSQKMKMHKIKICNDLIQESNLKRMGDKSQSFLFDRPQEFGSGDVPKTNSVPDFMKRSSEVSQNYILLKLKRLRDVNSDVLSCFPEDSRHDAALVMSELRKLYSTHCTINNPVRGSFLALCGTTPLDPLTSESLLDKKESDDHPNTFWDHIKTAMKLHKKPLFLLICLCRAVHFMTLVPVMTVVVDFVMDKGLKEEDGKYAIAALSLGDLLGRLCFGWVTDRGYMGLPRYMMVVMVLQGTSTLSLPLMYTKLTLYLMLAIFGLLQGSLFVRHNVLVSKYMENHEQSIAMGCVNFFSGLLGLGLPAYIGYFRDTIGTYDYIFYINGTAGILTGFLWILEPYFRECSTPEKSTEQESPVHV